MDNKDYKVKQEIMNGETSLGMEFGSTRIKAVLIGSDHNTIASGSYEWENSLDNGIWTYSLKDVWMGLQTAYRQLASQVKEKYDLTITKLGSMGFSGMITVIYPSIVRVTACAI